ncbi:MAG: hypothetical protein MUC92_10050, partial [Fimbriimonadaceae bacterium]|nr:hypothetical protein [Fimbriimonadaceae bacterium]
LPGRGIVLAAHDVNWATRVATHCVVLGGGRVLGQGPIWATLSEALLGAAYNCSFSLAHTKDGKSFWVSLG